MRRLSVAAASAALCALVVTGPRPAAADILVNISKTSQKMSVLVDGTTRHTWLVSTGSARHTTPSGIYKPQWLAKKWRSKKYGNAPMPNSIFFHDGYAIHGTTEIARLGKIASHGCVRLHPDNAAKLYALVEKQMANTRVVVSNDIIEAPGEAPKKQPGRFMVQNTVKEEPVSKAVTVAQKIAAPVTMAARIAEPVAVAQKLAEPEVKAVPAPPETTGSLRETRISPRSVQRETQKPVRTARAERPGFHW